MYYLDIRQSNDSPQLRRDAGSWCYRITLSVTLLNMTAWPLESKAILNCKNPLAINLKE